MQKSKIEFFLPVIPPTATAQEREVRVLRGAPVFYDPPAVREARAKLEAHLSRHRPEAPLAGGVRLISRWCYPIAPQSGHRDGEYKLTRPDTDNSVKLLKDCMTRVGFWKDDAQVASELIEKFWAEVPGIYIRIEALP